MRNILLTYLLPHSLMESDEEYVSDVDRWDRGPPLSIIMSRNNNQGED